MENYPAGRAPVREEAKGVGTHRTSSFSPATLPPAPLSLLTDAYWAGFWEKARLHQTGPEGLEPDCGLRRRRGFIS